MLWDSRGRGDLGSGEGRGSGVLGLPGKGGGRGNWVGGKGGEGCSWKPVEEG